jgi:hypothetical protein
MECSRLYLCVRAALGGDPSFMDQKFRLVRGLGWWMGVGSGGVRGKNANENVVKSSEDDKHEQTQAG